ncbi:MAG: hypothetical protein U0326_11835 [Polyangiales bacterium]
MLTIRSRRDLSLLLERQMTAASTRSGAPASIDEDIEGRTALKIYLLEAHGRMRSDPLGALQEIAGAHGITVTATDDPGLYTLQLGELQLWLDASGERVHRLYSAGAAKDVDRIHEALVSGTGQIECVWLPPSTLEKLAHHEAAKMVLFSLRHDRRPLRRTPDEFGIDSVTLRFWGPRAKETLEKLRHSEVLPGATSVYSVRMRVGDDERYCLAEVFHSGKITAIGTSFQELERIVSFLLDDHEDRTVALEKARKTPRRLTVPVRWTVDDLGYAVGRMFGGGEPFRLWGCAEQTGPENFRVRAVDLDVGRTAVFEIDRQGASLELGPRTPASVAVRFVSALQYHVSADTQSDALAPEPLLQLALPVTSERGAFRETSGLAEVGRAVLTEACSLLVRGNTFITPQALVEATHGAEASTDALLNLAHRVMSEAAAYEWRGYIKPVVSPDGRTAWRFNDPLPIDSTMRLRELGRLNRAAQQLVGRLAGTGLAKWLQLSLFGPEAMVTALTGDE